jgi:hypothetical protein
MDRWNGSPRCETKIKQLDRVGSRSINQESYRSRQEWKEKRSSEEDDEEARGGIHALPADDRACEGKLLGEEEQLK